MTTTLTTTDYKRPLPMPYVDTRPFWEYLKQHELRIQRCTATGRFFFPPAPASPYTLKPEFEWAKCSGRGTVYTWAVHHYTYIPSFKDATPYNTAIIELEEGVRILSRVTDCRNEDLYIGMPVEVWFDDVTPDFSLPLFRPSHR